jgi:hypothetical protein
MTDPTGRLHQLLGRLSRPSAQTPYSNRRVYLFGLLFVAVTVIAASVSIWELRRDWIANQMEDTNNLAVALAAQTAGTFQAIDLVLREAQALAERAEIFDPDKLRQQMASEKTHQFLVHSLHTLPQADGIALVDNNGTIVAQLSHLAHARSRYQRSGLLRPLERARRFRTLYRNARPQQGDGRLGPDAFAPDRRTTW